MIVEDDYFVAAELAKHFRAAKANVLGPFPTVEDALHHAEHADMAVLDPYLRDRKVYPLADKQMNASIPFVFYSAESMTGIPIRFAHVARLPKPQSPQETVELLNSKLHEVTITALLPRLRLSARLILSDPLAADRLVEATLLLAVRDKRDWGDLPPLAEWLHGLMNRALADRGRDLMN